MRGPWNTVCIMYTLCSSETLSCSVIVSDRDLSLHVYITHNTFCTSLDTGTMYRSEEYPTPQVAQAAEETSPNFIDDHHSYDLK